MRSPSHADLTEKFINAVKRDDIKEVYAFDFDDPYFDVNCTDEGGRSALRIAINNKSQAMCELLLKRKVVGVLSYLKAM